MSQYFEPNAAVSDYRTLQLNFRGKNLTYNTNAGLFSYTEPDPNSIMLLRHMCTCEHLSGDFLDLGCGWGLIGIALASAFNINLTMSDINPLALEFAESNAKLNNIKARVIESNGFEAFSSDDKFDCIALNPPIHAGKEVCFKLFEESALHLKPGGHFWIVMLDKHGAKTALKKIRDIYGITELIYKNKGVNVLRATFSA
ncbi:MAG: methyltransferase [Ruminococcus sp.]|jgi:16S rRNA (guanine1207-N2)-methyltransferase|nr:methyltransferase [Ruminococcus sp.]